MKRIYLIDCPGIVPPSLGDTPEDILLRGVVRVENVENPAQYVPAVLARCQTKHLERTYDVKWSAVSNHASADTAAENGDVVGRPGSDKEKTAEAIRFLEALARKGGRLLRGGEADLDGVAKMVLNDFLRGKIPWFVRPPDAPTPEGDASTAKDETAGRDAMLGFTHGKRKRELGDDGREGLQGDASAGEEGSEGEGDADADADEFEGFEGESDSADEVDGGIELKSSKSESGSED